MKRNYIALTFLLMFAFVIIPIVEGSESEAGSLTLGYWFGTHDIKTKAPTTNDSNLRILLEGVDKTGDAYVGFGLVQQTDIHNYDLLGMNMHMGVRKKFLIKNAYGLLDCGASLDVFSVFEPVQEFSFVPYAKFEFGIEKKPAMYMQVAGRRSSKLLKAGRGVFLFLGAAHKVGRLNLDFSVGGQVNAPASNVDANIRFKADMENPGWVNFGIDIMKLVNAPNFSIAVGASRTF